MNRKTNFLTALVLSAAALTAAALAVSRQAAVKFLKKRAISIKQQNRSAT